MAHIENPSTSGMFSLLEWIGDRLSPLAKLRDGLLVTAVIVYILGYLVWSLNALVHGFGLLPALEFQYFVAGVFPAVLIWLVYIGIRNGKQITENLAKRIGPDAKEGLRLLRQFIRFVFFGVSTGFLTSVVLILTGQVPLAVSGALGYLLVLVGPFFIATTSAGESPGVWYYMVITFCLAGLFLYVFVIYPQLPQALGGLRPRCVYLDVKKAEMSNETLKDIFPVDAIKSSSEVVRSVKVDIFFSGGEFMRVRLHVEKQGVTPRVYEIRKSIVQAVVSCK